MAAAVNLRITGRVQGVGYRAWFRDEAERLGLTGWVRNRRDGSVEAEVAGDFDLLRQMTEWAAKGPAFASVAEVTATQMPSSDSLVGMEIRPTA